MSATEKERRNYPRFDLDCPLKILADGDAPVRKTHTENLSDGGAFVSLPIDALPKFGSELTVALSVPRTTPNTYMLEEFTCKARVVRQQPLRQHDRAGVALQFVRPQKLVLQV